MPDTSIVVKATDRYSDTMKKMSNATKAFKGDVDKMEETLTALSKNKVTLKMDISKAKSELKAAEKQFALTHDAADKLKLEMAQANYDGMVRNLKAVTNEARATEKAISKVGNSAGGGGGGIGSALAEMTKGFATGQIGQMVSSSLSGLVSWGMTSAIGAPTANLISEAVGGAITGATAGAIAGIPGMVVGGIIGTVSGAISGGTKIKEAKDDAFKSYVEDAYETVTSEQSSSLTSGSSVAGSREQTRMAFAQRMGDAEADAYLERVKTMATSTNYSYDEITGYSKLLLNTYDGDKTLSVLQTLSDASAGLNLDSSDVNMFISGLSRMRTTGKTTQEYLNYFSERGVDVYQALADATGADKSDIAGMVTKGSISGADAAEAILTYIDETYGGLSDKLATTYDAMVDNLADFQADMDAAMGEGYNEGRKAGLQAQMDWMSGESGAAVEEANRAIGAWQADLENQKEEFIRKAMDTMMESDEYQTARAEGDVAEMGRLLMQAKVQGMNAYNASDGAQLALESEMSLVAAIRNDTGLNQDYWDAGYEKGQEFTKGLAAALVTEENVRSILERMSAAGLGGAAGLDVSAIASGFAYGLDYVPYDGFPAVLHQGERVLTAGEARTQDSGGVNVTIQVAELCVREEADVERIVAELVEQLELARMAG